MSDSGNRAPNPFIGARSFERNERLYGRDREARDLMGLLIAERIVLLCSPSGAGKTSLVQALLIPQLEQEFTVLPIIRVSREAPIRSLAPIAVSPTDTSDPVQSNGIPNAAAALHNGAAAPNRYLLSTFVSLEAQPSAPDEWFGQLAGVSLAEYLDQRPDSAEDQVLIFDQFEEILTIDPTDREVKQDFFAQIGAALRNRRRWALFIMREEYVAALDPFLRFIPTRLSTSFRLDLLGVAAARAAMSGPAEARGVRFESAALNRLINDLRRVQVPQIDGSILELPGPAVEPVLLQVVCYRLWERLAPDATAITEADVEALGNVSAALSDYYAQEVAAVAARSGVSERTIRDWFETQLITPQGIRGQVVQGLNQSQGLDNHAIRALNDVYLIRTETRRGVTWFELAHDRLVAPVRDNNAQWRTHNLSPLQRQAALWESQNRPDGLLFKDQMLVAAETWAALPTSTLTPVEEQFLQRCREVRTIVRRARQNNRVIRILAVVALVGLIGVTLLTVQTNRLYQNALTQTLIAETERLSSNPGSLALALLLGREATNRASTPETQGALLRALGVSPYLQTYLRGYTDDVRGVAFSPDGTLLATAGCASSTAFTCMAGEIRLWDVAQRSPLGEPIQTGNSLLYSVAFHPNGQILAVAGFDQVIEVWDIATRQRVQTLRGHANTIWSVAYSPDGRTLASAGCAHVDNNSPCAEGQIRLWDTATGQARGVPLNGHTGEIYSVAFSPDGTQLLSGGGDGLVILWDVARGSSLQTFTGHTGAVVSVAFSPAGATAASGAADTTIRMWDLASGSSTEGRGHSNTVYGVAFSADGTTLVSGGADGLVLLWDVTSMQVRGQPLTGHRDEVFGVAIHADATLASIGPATLVLWDTSTRHRLARPLVQADAPIIAADVQADGSTLAALTCARESFTQATATCRTGTLLQWDTRAPTREATLRSVPISGVGQLAASPGAPLLATAGCPVDAAGSRCVAGQVRLWNSATLQAQGPPLETPAPVTSLAFSPDGQTLAAGCSNGALVVWNVANQPSGERITNTSTSAILSLAFDPTGQTLATGDENGDIVVWDIPTQQPRGESLRGHILGVTSLVFHPNQSHLLVSGSADRALIVWDTRDQQQRIPVANAHASTITEVAFSTTSPMLISAGADGLIRLWHIDATAQPVDQPTLLGALQAHRDAVTAVTPVKSAPHLLSTSNDASVLVWSIDPESWRTTACQVAARNLQDEEWNTYLTGTPYRRTCPDVP